MALIYNTDLNVEDKFSKLLKVSMDQDSPYVRAKETLQEMVDSGFLDNKQKESIVSNILGNIVSSVTNGCMQVALSWETSEKELYLKKLQIEKEIELQAQQILSEKVNTDLKYAEKQASQAESIRKNGVSVLGPNGDVIELGDNGTAYESILNIRADVANKAIEKTTLEARERQVNAEIHKIIADTYSNYGTYAGYTVANDGVTSVTKNSNNLTQNDTQIAIAQEQIKGYAYNLRANTISGAGSMIGLLSGDSTFVGEITEMIAGWRTVFDTCVSTPTTVYNNVTKQFEQIVPTPYVPSV